MNKKNNEFSLTKFKLSSLSSNIRSSTENYPTSSPDNVDDCWTKTCPNRSNPC